MKAARITAYGAPDVIVFDTRPILAPASGNDAALRADGPLLPLPDSLSHTERAAFFFGGMTAAGFLIDKAQLAAGESVLIAGAVGAVGSAVVQIARHVGAKVTATASVQNLQLARDLGAEVALDYRAPPPSGPFDVILDVMGTYRWQKARPLVSGQGRLGLVTVDLTATLGAMLRPRRGGRRLMAATVTESRAKMQRLVDLHLAGGFRPIVGKTLPFSNLRAAHAIADTFHKVGNLVIKMDAAA